MHPEAAEEAGLSTCAIVLGTMPGWSRGNDHCSIPSILTNFEQTIFNNTERGKGIKTYYSNYVKMHRQTLNLGLVSMNNI